jgi:hypothetical protein
MTIIWFNGSTELARKRAAKSKQRELEKRDHKTELVSKLVKEKVIWGVKYW